MRFARGKGSYLYDIDGREYLDLVSGIGVASLGHAHAGLAAALADQARTLVHTSNLYYHSLQGQVASRLAKLSGLPRAFLCNSGAEAVEACLKFARRYWHTRGETNRKGIVALERAFHGRTFGALSVTWDEHYRTPFAPLVDGVTFVPPDDPAALMAAVSPTTAAIIIEPIQGEAGVWPLTPAFARTIDEICQQTGTLLIADEVQCGLGRTGHPFYFSVLGLRPQLVAIGKALGGGVPVAAALISQEVAAAIAFGDHGSTYGGNLLACRAALVFLDALVDGGVLAQIRRTGAHLERGLRSLASKQTRILDVRGAGLLWGIELNGDAAPVVDAALSRGLLIQPHCRNGRPTAATTHHHRGRDRFGAVHARGRLGGASGRHVMIEPIDGGVTAAAGFRAAGTACGIKSEGLDFALIVCDAPASAAGLFTTNLTRAAPVTLSVEHLARTHGVATAVVVNSGCANACTGEPGMAVAREMAAETARRLACPVEQVLVASTGLIGMTPDVSKVKAGIASAAQALGREGHRNAAEAIMTTDRGPKEAAVRISTPAGVFHIGGMVKGAGMIEPHMATMLAFVTTDARIDATLLRRGLAEAVDETFNAITVDADRSTNDSVFALAGGASQVQVDAAVYPAFAGGLRHVCLELALAIVRGGEGATKLIAVRATGAQSVADARQAARAIANSPLVKTAVHGGDPNWGRLMAAAGRAGVAFDPSRASIKIGPAVLYRAERAFSDQEPLAAAHLHGPEVELEVDLGTGGNHAATIWTCDLSAEYVRINADYRT